MKIILSKAVAYDGESIKEIELNLEGLTGQDMIDAQKEVGMQEMTPVQEFSKEHLAILAAKACGKGSDFIPLLPIKDFSKLTLAVQDFLFGEA
ncbi:MAG: phage tail assembly protein [Cellulosilyticaceae bacterium]